MPDSHEIDKMKNILYSLSGDVKVIINNLENIKANIPHIEERIKNVELYILRREEGRKIYTGIFGFILKNWAFFFVAPLILLDVASKLKYI